MQKTSIAIASVLKPLKDPRAFYRLGASLRETNKYEINIIGFSRKKEEAENGINFHTLFDGHRKNLSRIAVGWRFIRLLFSIRPKVLIVGTYELLPASVFGKLLLNYTLVYDVQENYLLNLEHNRSATGISKALASGFVKAIESGCRRQVDHFLLAEKCYASELPDFNPATVLENRFFGLPADILPCRFNQNKLLKFLISGTITEVYGILEGIRWFLELRKQWPNSKLQVIGHCPNAKYRAILESENVAEAINLTLSDDPIPYRSIIEAYRSADVILLPYWQIPSITGKIPSKLFEALALGKVCLFSMNQPWNDLVDNFDAGFAVDFDNLNEVQKAAALLQSKEFFTNKPDLSLTWKSRESAFLNLIAQLAK